MKQIVPATLALLATTALTATVASAQTTVTRQVTTMPVETTVTQSPGQTVVTRRVIDAPRAVAAPPRHVVRAPAPRAYGYVPAQPVVLTPEQRGVVYHSIIDSGGVPAAAYDAASDDAVYTVGERIPADVRLVSLPDSLYDEVPAIAPYAYARVDGRVLLVDPDSGMIVADVTQ